MFRAITQLRTLPRKVSGTIVLAASRAARRWGRANRDADWKPASSGTAVASVLVASASALGASGFTSAIIVLLFGWSEQPLQLLDRDAALAELGVQARAARPVVGRPVRMRAVVLAVAHRILTGCPHHGHQRIGSRPVPVHMPDPLTTMSGP